MLKKLPKPEEAKQAPFTYIHIGTTVNGDIQATGRLRIHGRVLGNLMVEGCVEVADTGIVEGTYIRAEEVKILGQVKANVEVTGKIEIWQSGRLEGDVKASSLDIEEGASFIGRSDMQPAHQFAASLPKSSLEAGNE